MMIKYKNAIAVSLTVVFILAGGLLVSKHESGIECEKLSAPVSVTQSTQRELFVGESVNINTATQTELERVPGIGPSLASSIIEYRDEHGAFSSINELDDVKGIGSSTLEDIADYLRTEG